MSKLVHRKLKILDENRKDQQLISGGSLTKLAHNEYDNNEMEVVK